MAIIRPQTTWPTVPVPETAFYQRPVGGNQMSSFASAANYLIGWRYRRCVHTQVDYDLSGLVMPDVELLSPIGLTLGVSVIWKLSERAKHIWFHIVYQAVKSTGAASVYIDASLLSWPAGVVVDSGVRFDHDRGDLVTELRTDSIGLVNFNRYQLCTAHSGAVPDDAPPAAPNNFPRPLNVGTLGGSDGELRLAVNNVRIHSVDVWELFEPEDTQ